MEGHQPSEPGGDPFDSPVSSPPATSRRRQSAAGRAIALRRQSFEEIGETPPRTRLVTYPATSTPSAGPVTPSDPVPTSPVPSPPQEPGLPSPNSDQDSPKFNRSGKKRTLTQTPGARKASKRMSEKKTTKDADDPFAKLARLIKGLEDKIQQSEVRMSTKIETKIDNIASNLGERIGRTEAQVTALGTDIARTQADVALLREGAGPEAVRRLVDEALNARPTQNNARRPRPLSRHTMGLEDPMDADDPEVATDPREERYWTARRQLRIWPVLQTADLDSGVRAFLRDKLGMESARIDRLQFEVQPVNSRQDSPAQNQAVVTFTGSRERDEVRAKASNLQGGDKTVGCQLEPPDHLRGHYKAFQNLAFCLKKKNPDLKRNIKFEDGEQTLIMDVKMNGEWKTVHYATARGLLKLKSQGTDAISRQQLRDFLSNSDVAASDDDGENTTMTDVNVNKSKDKRSRRSLAFINANARSLGPKICSLSDCFTEKCLDLAAVSETWFQSNKDRDELVEEMEARFSLGLLTRERSLAASNGRQYGGVALAYRLKTTRLDPFPLNNPNDYEVLAALAKVDGVKTKIFTMACYAPPNLTPTQADGLIEFLSDVVCEAKRTFEDCMILVMGDFNQWSVQELLDDHPDLTEVPHGPTRADSDRVGRGRR